MKSDRPYQGTPFDLTDKTALVSGGGGLLGQEFALALASAGANVVLADIRYEKLSAVRNLILATHPKSRLLLSALDVTQPASIKECVGLAISQFGSLDILVNSAAMDPKFEKSSDVSRFSSFTDFPLKLWEDSIGVNLTGTFLLTQSVGQVMEKKGEGSIITIGSNYGLVGPDQRIYRKTGEKNQSYKPPVYSVCKAGLIGFTKFLAAYYQGTKIRVNMLTPSGVFSGHDSEFASNYSRNTILGRMSHKEEYHGAILFLASQASSYMTGSNLVIDGGWTAL